MKIWKDLTRQKSFSESLRLEILCCPSFLARSHGILVMSGNVECNQMVFQNVTSEFCHKDLCFVLFYQTLLKLSYYRNPIIRGFLIF